VTTLSRKERDVLEADWPVFAHGHQQPPELGPNGAPWVTWLIVGGRGAGNRDQRAQLHQQTAVAVHDDDASLGLRERDAQRNGGGAAHAADDVKVVRNLVGGLGHGRAPRADGLFGGNRNCVASLRDE